MAVSGGNEPESEEVKAMARMLTGKIAVVTGSGGGIGREFALAMAAAGAKVVVNDIGASLGGEGQDSAPARNVVAEIEAAGGTAVANFDSVSTWESAAAIIQSAVDSFGRVDIVVNNAGVLRDRSFHKMSLEEWTTVINVHLNGTFFVSRAAAPYFKEQNAGAYVHIVSTSGLIGNSGQANYGAAKMGITALSRTIAIEMAKFGVRSNCLSPFAWSRMISSIPTDTPEQQLRVSKLMRMEAGKVAPLAVYLGSDQAADVTGQVFCVRANEIFLMSQSRPLRSIHESSGWTAESIANHAIPALRSDFYKLDRSADVFSWDPV
jgi:NAD(P)-dependent dehydrogenase (short-subunit alcohol dehydrogenase family)